MLLFCILLACTWETPAAPSTAPPTAPQPPAVSPPAAQPPPSIAVGLGTIHVAGEQVDTTLHPVDERRIPALYEALPGSGGEFMVQVAQGVTWRPVRRVLLTADARGLGPFWLSVDGGERRGPLTLPVAQPPALDPQEPRPVGLLRLHQGEQAWLQAEVRFRGLRPVDCATVYAEDARLRTACMAGEGAASTSLGCLVRPDVPAGAVAAWPAALSTSLAALGAGERWSWVVLVDTGVSATVLDTVLGALQATAPQRMAIGGASATSGSPGPCTEAVRTAADIAERAARWGGASE